MIRSARRALGLLVGTAAVLVAAAVPAGAAGVGGVEVTPRSGTAFNLSVSDGETVRETFTVRNIGEAAATVRLYAAAAEQTESGTWSVAGAGSAPWLEFADREVSLEPGETQELSFAARGSDEARNGAIVIEQGSGTVVQRAATLVYVKQGPTVPLPLLLILIAVVLIALAAAAWVTAARRHRQEVAAAQALAESADDSPPARGELALAGTQRPGG